MPYLLMYIYYNILDIIGNEGIKLYSNFKCIIYQW